MITKDELRRRVRIAKYPRRNAALVPDAPDHNPLILEDCPGCHGSGRICIEENGSASQWECPTCGGTGITDNVVHYFDNNEPIRFVCLNSYGWVTCPYCNFTFSPSDKDAWSGLRHFRCGQRLEIVSVDKLIVEGIQKILAYWDDGLLTRGEIEDRLIELATRTDIDKFLAKLPAPWHDLVLAQLQRLAESESDEFITIFGGIYSNELMSDPEKAAELKRELKEQQALEAEQFKNIVLPMIRNWWAKRKNERTDG